MEIRRPSEPDDLEKQLQFQRSFGASTGTTPTSNRTPIDAHTHALMAQDLSDDDDDNKDKEPDCVLAPPDVVTPATDAIRDDYSDFDDDDDFMSQVQEQMTFATEAPGLPPDELPSDIATHGGTAPVGDSTPSDDRTTQPSSDRTLPATLSVTATLPPDDGHRLDYEKSVDGEHIAEASSRPVDDASRIPSPPGAIEPLLPPPVASTATSNDASLVLGASQSVELLPPMKPSVNLARQPTSLPDLHTWPSDLLAMKPISPALLPYLHGFEPPPACTDLVPQHKPLHPKPPPPKKAVETPKARYLETITKHTKHRNPESEEQVKAWLERKKAEQAKLRALQATQDPNQIEAEKARRRAEAQHQFEVWSQEKAKLTHKLAKEKKAAEQARLEDRKVLHATHTAEIHEVQLQTHERLATMQREKHQRQRHHRRKVAKLVQQRQTREYDDMRTRLEKIQSVLTRVTQNPTP